MPTEALPDCGYALRAMGERRESSLIESSRFEPTPIRPWAGLRTRLRDVRSASEEMCEQASLQVVPMLDIIEQPTQLDPLLVHPVQGATVALDSMVSSARLVLYVHAP